MKATSNVKQPTINDISDDDILRDAIGDYDDPFLQVFDEPFMEEFEIPEEKPPIANTDTEPNQILSMKGNKTMQNSIINTEKRIPIVSGKSNQQTKVIIGEEEEMNEQARDILTENTIQINNKPDASKLWQGLGGNFETISQVASELVDNSISNIIGNSRKNRTVSIEITEKKDGIHFRVEDTGTGIKNLDATFTLCDTSGRESTFSAHGLGLKHALSTANPDNDNWFIYTRTDEDVSNSVYKEIAPKYTFEGFHAKIRTDIWPGNYNSSGTIIEFLCNRELFETVAQKTENKDSSFEHLIDIFIEDLGFTYATIIKENKVMITVKSIDIAGNIYTENIAPVEPEWSKSYTLLKGSERFDLGGGSVEIQFCFGKIKEQKDNHKYYKRNMESSGCEIRLNGRVLSYNLLEEIWRVAPHPSFNSFLAIIDVVSDDINALPETRTSKNGFRKGDPKLVKLYQKIRSLMPKPIKDQDLDNSEVGLFKRLAEQKMIHLRGNPTVTLEMEVFTSLGERIRIDMHVSNAEENIPYEGKKNKTTPLNVYQLMLYWDGLVYDGIQPTEAVLIGAKHPDSVHKIVEQINKRLDANGKKYNFVVRTWSDEGINIASA